MKKYKHMLVYLLVLAGAFYLLPFLAFTTGSAMFILLIALPLVCIVCSLCYGLKHGFSLIYIAALALLFTPTIFIYYNSSAWVYIFAYSAAAVLGNFVGAAIKQVKK